MSARTRVTVIAVALLGVIGVAGVARLATTDDWGRLIEAGDALVAGRALPSGVPPGLTPRAAYLLAFHHAQDAAQVSRMLVAADRLERLGERDVAAWAREAARAVAAEGERR